MLKVLITVNLKNKENSPALDVLILSSKMLECVIKLPKS